MITIARQSKVVVADNYLVDKSVHMLLLGIRGLQLGNDPQIKSHDRPYLRTVSHDHAIPVWGYLTTVHKQKLQSVFDRRLKLGVKIPRQFSHREKRAWLSFS